MRVHSPAFLFRIAATVLLLSTFAAPGARADETADQLNHLNGIYKINCAMAREARSQSAALDRWIIPWFGSMLYLDDIYPPGYFEAFEDKALQRNSWLEISHSLDLACKKARAAYGQALSEAMLTQWLGEPSTPANVAKPPSANADAAATDQQCNALLKRGTELVVSGIFAQADFSKLGVPPKLPLARERFSKALAIYRRGAALCKHGRFPAEFAKRIRSTTQSLRKAGG
jgi:hypothetical protein